MKQHPGDRLSRETRAALEMGSGLARLGFGYGTAADLVAIARQLGRLDERACNGYQTYSGEWDEAADKRGERRTARLEALVAELVQQAIERGMVPAGTRCYHQGDPRGAALYVCGPDVPEPLESHYNRGIALY